MKSYVYETVFDIICIWKISIIIYDFIGYQESRWEYPSLSQVAMVAMDHGHSHCDLGSESRRRRRRRRRLLCQAGVWLRALRPSLALGVRLGLSRPWWIKFVCPTKLHLCPQTCTLCLLFQSLPRPPRSLPRPPWSLPSPQRSQGLKHLHGSRAAETHWFRWKEIDILFTIAVTLLPRRTQPMANNYWRRHCQAVTDWRRSNLFHATFSNSWHADSTR